MQKIRNFYWLVENKSICLGFLQEFPLKQKISTPLALSPEPLVFIN